MGAYKDYCGELPTKSDSAEYICRWWNRACVLGDSTGEAPNERKIGTEEWWLWWGDRTHGLWADIIAEEGYIPHFLQAQAQSDGDYLKIWMGTYPEIFLGRFKWNVPLQKGNLLGVWCAGYPNCASEFAEGNVVEVEARMQNLATTTQEFRMYLVDDDTGEELAKFPELTYKSVKAGEIWTAKSGLIDKFNFIMPAKDLKLRVSLRRQT